MVPMRNNAVAEPVLTLTYGAVDAYPAVMRALSRRILFDLDPAFLAQYEDVNEKARTALRLSNQPVILQGAPTLGVEAAAASLIAAEDTVLNLVNGVYSKGFSRWARRYCKNLVEVEISYDEAFDLNRVESALKDNPGARIVSLCHHETPSGTINPLAEIGKLVAARDGYVIVDAVSSFGGMDIHPEESHSDIFVAAGQKCLGAAPGLALMAVSERAWKKMKANPDAPRGSYLSLLDWENAWSRETRFPSNISVPLIYALDAALDLYLAEGPQAVWARHALTGKVCRAGIRAMGLDLWPVSESIAAPMTTAVRIPQVVVADELYRHLRDHHRIMLPSGAGDTLGKVVHISHMGPSAQPLLAVAAIAALGSSLAACGHPVDLGQGVAAAMKIAEAAR
jgi:pyridoxamine---pyruvate transaminase